MSGHKLCRCGKPITDGAHLCADCVDGVRTCLDRIAERWSDLEAALTSSEDGGEAGRQKCGMVSVGTNLNETVSRARGLCHDVLWFAVQVIRDDLDDAGRDFAPPRFRDDGDLARWLADWQVPHLTAATAEETALEIADDLAEAEQATFDAINPPPRWIAVTGCTKHGTSDTGDRVPCLGVLRAKVGTGVMPDLVCDTDPAHVLSPQVWGREGWKKRRASEPRRAGWVLMMAGHIEAGGR